MIKFPGSPPQMGPLCLPDGWPTGFFLPSALPSEPVGVWGGGASPGSTEDPALQLPLSSLLPQGT